MKPITLYRHITGEWVTNLMERAHTVTLSANDDHSFLSMGILEKAPIRIEVNQRGVILDVVDHSTELELTSFTIPVNHSLHKEVNIGRPV